MSRFVKFNPETVQYSIVNPLETKTFLDTVTPFSFADFLKYTKENYSPTQYNDFYLFYIQQWTDVKKIQEEDKTIFVKEQYKSLLQDIALNYTTNEEKRFLANIDYDDPEDLEIIVPFYSSKIREIILYYKSLRDKIELNTFNYKQKGTTHNIRKAIAENTLDYIFHTKQDVPISVPLEETFKNIDIYLEELVDTFGGYYNLGSTPDVDESELRKHYYTANYNNVDPNLFINFNQTLTNTIFNKVFLRALGSNFTINTGQVYDPFCNPNNPLALLIKSKTVNNITPSQKLILQQQLLQKYLGVDLYYFTRSSATAYLSGVLVTASNPSGNFLNVTNPSTATIPSQQLVALRKLGLYFSPDKRGLLKFDVRSKKVFLNPDAAEIGKTYVFPDPTVYGNVQYSNDDIIPITYAFDYEGDIKGISSTYSYGDPKIETRDQSYYGYFSNQQLQDASKINDKGLEVNLTANYSRGYVHTWKTDVFGNQYGLFKEGYRQGISDKSDLVDFEASNLFSQYFLNSTLSSSKTTYSSTASSNQFIYIDQKAIDYGTVYVKNGYTNKLLPLSSALTTTFYKYSSAVKYEIYDKVQQFEIFYDTIVLQTPNYLVIDSVKVDSNGIFEPPLRPNTYMYSSSSDRFSKFSNRIFVEQDNKIFFYKTQRLTSFADDYSKVVIPYVYSYDIITKRLQKVFPENTDIPFISSYFSHRVFRAGESYEGIGVNIIRVDTPKISYNSYNNVFNITYLGKDLNNGPYIFNYTLKRTNTNMQILCAEVFDNLGFEGSGTTSARENETYIQFYKKTLNYYSVSAIDTNLVTVVGSDSANSEYISLIDQNFNSYLNTNATINNINGTLEI